MERKRKGETLSANFAKKRAVKGTNETAWLVKEIVTHKDQGSIRLYKVKYQDYRGTSWKKLGTFQCLPGVLENYLKEIKIGSVPDSLDSQASSHRLQRLESKNSRYPHAKRRNCPIKIEIRKSWVRASLQSVKIIPNSSIFYLDTKDCLATRELLKQAVPLTIFPLCRPFSILFQHTDLARHLGNSFPKNPNMSDVIWS